MDVLQVFCLEQAHRQRANRYSSLSAVYGFGTALAREKVKDPRGPVAGTESVGAGLIMAHADKTLDIKGLVEPRPAIVIEMTMDQLRPGQVLSVIANDAAARESVQALCAERGYVLLEMTRVGSTFHFTIQKRNASAYGTSSRG